jgi:hypothetical protein
MISLMLSAMMISPWNGVVLPTVAQSAATYRLTVRGKPGATIRLTATRISSGWIAAFCDDRTCSPMHVEEKIPKSGEVVIAFELIRETGDAPHRSGAVIKGSDRSYVRVPSAVR